MAEESEKRGCQPTASGPLQPSTPLSGGSAVREKDQKQMIQGIQELPTRTLTSAMQMILDVINGRGDVVRDWDHKDKVVRQVKVIGAHPYVLCTKGKKQERQFETEVQQLQRQVQQLQTKVQQLLKENAYLRGRRGERRE